MNMEIKKLRLDVGGDSIELASAASMVMRNRYEELIHDDVLVLESLPLGKRTDILADAADLTANYVTAMSIDEVLERVPNGRQNHNDFFSKVNTSFNIIGFKPDMPDEKKQRKYVDIIKDSQSYVTALFEAEEALLGAGDTKGLDI